MFKFTSKIGLIGLAFSLFIGCKDRTPNYPIEPSIAFNKFTKYNNGTAVMKFDFKDGDHDIGNSTDLGANFFFTLYVKNGTTWDSITSYTYVIPKMDVNNNRAYEGEIDVTVYEPYALLPVSKYLCYLKDRAGHISNSVWTDEIIP
jgi:hypothetical protein